MALLEDKQLVELHTDSKNCTFSVGDIYLGRVRKIVLGLNAAFIDVGYEKDAFLHYLDLGPQVRSFQKQLKHALTGKLPDISQEGFLKESDIDKTDKISNILKPGQKILVQIAKEPISTKGPRVTSEIMFPGRYIILIPFSDKVSISQKIKDADERSRLKKLIHGIKPNNFGVIIRTVAENVSLIDIENDMKSLVDKWNLCFKQLLNAEPPQKVLGEIDRTSVLLRDMLNDAFNHIVVNDVELHEEIKQFVTRIAPDKADIVKLYKGKESVFEHYGIDKQIKSSFGKTITVKNGSYLIIEHTEALHVIDVNSGYRSGEGSQETNATTVNLDAAKEIARQLRLRDMGGIIVIDFIDMHDLQNRKKLYEVMKDEMLKDRAKHTILPVNKFGLLQITRQRVRPETKIDIREKCPVCDGTGKIRPSVLIIDELENNIKYLNQEQNYKELTLAVHPFIYAYLTKGLISLKTKWRYKHHVKLKVQSFASFHFTEFQFFDKQGVEINL